jgi:RND family efflux transporter MFP subunit
MGIRSSLRLPLSAAIVAVLALLPACTQEVEEKVPVARPVKMLTFGGGATGQVLEYPGTISPAQQADLGFEVQGMIQEFPAKEGQLVEKGDVLARLDPRDYQESLNKAEAMRRASESDYERYKVLFQEKVVSERDLDVKFRNFEASTASWQQAKKALDDTRLRAPFSGKVARILVEDFVNVQAKETVLILQDDSHLEIKVSIPERDFVRAEPGLSMEERTARARPRVVVASIPDREFPARLTEIATTADPVTRTYEVTCTLANPEDVLVRPGMTAKLAINPSWKASGGSSFIPAGAVFSDETQESLVWVVDSGSNAVKRRQVELGEMSGDEIQVISGLSEGEVIAVSGVHNLREGMPVRPFEK